MLKDSSKYLTFVLDVEAKEENFTERLATLRVRVGERAVAAGVWKFTGVLRRNSVIVIKEPYLWVH